jgi:mannose-6-phosphate isomerase-like protein (cupin superfamily)
MTIHQKPGMTGERLMFKGTLVDIQLPSRAGQDGISVIEHRMPYRETPPLHVHRNEDEVFHVLEGRMRFRVGNVEIMAEAGQTVLAPKGIPHSFRVESVEGARCLTITRGDNFETMVREMGEPARAAILMPFQEPSPEMVKALTEACARNGIDIVGAPLMSPPLPAPEDHPDFGLKGLALPGKDVFTLPMK